VAGAAYPPPDNGPDNGRGYALRTPEKQIAARPHPRGDRGSLGRAVAGRAAGAMRFRYTSAGAMTPSTRSMAIVWLQVWWPRK
jgi:hypothetical protein